MKGGGHDVGLRDKHGLDLALGLSHAHGDRRLGFAMKDQIEVYTDNAGFFRFRIKSGNGEVIATSEAYGGKDEALENLESVKNSAASAPVVDLTGS